MSDNGTSGHVARACVYGRSYFFCRADALAPRENDEPIVQITIVGVSSRLDGVFRLLSCFIASLSLGIVATCRAPSILFQGALQCSMLAGTLLAHLQGREGGKRSKANEK